MSVSMFNKCPNCGAMIVKDTTCPSCHHSENAPPVEDQIDVAAEYARRRQTHTTNYMIFMFMMFGLGLVGLILATCWFFTIFRGNLLAFVGVIFFSIVGAGLGYMLKISKTLFPTEFNCPACNIRLDEMPLNAGHCPGCGAKLR